MSLAALRGRYERMAGRNSKSRFVLSARLRRQVRAAEPPSGKAAQRLQHRAFRLLDADFDLVGELFPDA
jgi:hypothetical protein